MASRGMGLKPTEFLDFVQEVVNKDKRKTPFVNFRPGYDRYYAFMRRNRHIIEMRTENSLETCRAKLTKKKTDYWYISFRDFLSVKGLIDKPKCIWNADESGFSMESVSSKVIHKSKTSISSSSSDRWPQGYNPLTGALYGSDTAYIKKGWMDASTFAKFLDNFHLHAGEERPVALLIDSVSSHIFMPAFELACKRGIELYRIVPNAMHLMQPLDVGVFGPLKQRWHQVVRSHTRISPVINAFRSSGIYPVDTSTVIKNEHLKPGITFGSAQSKSLDESTTESSLEIPEPDHQQPSGSSLALEKLETALTTPIKAKYTKRIKEGYDVEGQSPCYYVYKKLLSTTCPKTVTNKPITASVCEPSENVQSKPAVQSETNVENEPVCGLDMRHLHSYQLHRTKLKRKSQIDDLPNNLTSSDS
ncbi:hypothetical protein MAR_010554 [Mya arenaria]|uniref:DDE-1 domain-containing protein n=1 Tax=Mya arenaria TaxID=6604 RepID=A0ABY7E4V5_MYAAR|nr:hypothetical protein MAR_010554 [Mya arenaria]